MRHLLSALVFCAAAFGADPADTAVAAVKAAAAKNGAAGQTAVSQCFKVHRLLKTDSTHYWADWTNTCPYTIDAVYVMVGFRDRSLQEMGSGVWPMYFVEPGVHRVTRFSAPVADFETVHVHGITTDSTLALKPDPGPMVPANAAADPYAVGDKSVGKVAAAGSPGASPSNSVASSSASAKPAATSAKPGAKTAATSAKPALSRAAKAAPAKRARVRSSGNRTKY